MPSHLSVHHGLWFSDNSVKTLQEMVNFKMERDDALTLRWGNMRLSNSLVSSYYELGTL